MPQDAFTLGFVAKELKDLFTGGKISKINQPERDRLTFLIYTKKGTLKLEISTSAQSNRISLGYTDMPNPKNAPNFCMLLRKHLQNAEILDVAQVGFERIIYFDFRCFSEFAVSEMRLYCEIMGKYSNVILTERGTILGAMKLTSLENAKRVLFSGVKYVLPEPQDKADPTSLPALEMAFENKCGDAAEFIIKNVSGIAYSTALEMTGLYGENITAEQVYEYVNGGVYQPCVTYNDGDLDDFKVRSNSENKKLYPSLLEAQTAYYSYVCAKKAFNERKTKLESAVNAAVKKLEKRLDIENGKLAECSRAEQIKLKGELITANIYAVQRGASSFKAVNYYDENMSEITIELDKNLSPSQNAQKYYKRYAKMRRTVESVTAQREETLKRLEYLHSIRSNILAAENLNDLSGTEEELIAEGLKRTEERKKTVQNSAPFRTYEKNGFTILSGRNNVQNDRLAKGLSADDIWLHTQKYHSSHVAVLSGGKSVPDEVILTAAEICAYYSEARVKDKAPVDYTFKKFVKKPPKSPSGFAVYTDYKTILVAPDAHTELRKDNE